MILRKTLFPIVIATLVLLSASYQSVEASIDSYADQPPPLAGWTHNPAFTGDTPQRHGVVLSGKDVIRSSPTIAEIDGNTSNGKEVAVAGSDGILYVYHANGSLLWSTNLATDSCSTTDSRANSAPAVGALYGDGEPYVVIGYGTILQSSCEGGVAAFRGPTGAQAWKFSLKAWAASEGYQEAIYGVVSSPSLADTDGDGALEIAFGGLDRNLYLLNNDGSVRWYYHAADTIWSSPAFANVDSDPELEVIAGTDISANASLKTPDGGYMYAFDTQVRTPKKIAFRTGYIWRTEFDQTIYSSPVIADVLSSNPGSEIIIGNGCYFPVGSSNKRGKWIKILSLTTGAVLKTLNTPACVQSSVAVGDIFDEGKLAVVATVSGDASIGGDGKSRIMAWKPDVAADPINATWSTIPTDPSGGQNDSFGGDLQSPIIADLDGNGSLEVIAGNFWSLHVLNGKTGAPLTCQNTSCGTQKSFYTWKTVKSTPAIGDIDNDGKPELVIGSGNAFNSAGNGQLYVWTNLASAISSPAGAKAAFDAPWPMFRGNAQHTGVLPAAPSALKISPTQLNPLLAVNTSMAVDLGISDDLGNTVSWSIQQTDASNVVQVPASGNGKTAHITLTASGSAGTYNATLLVQSSGLPDQTMQVQLKVVAELLQVYLPAAIR